MSEEDSFGEKHNTYWGLGIRTSTITDTPLYGNRDPFLYGLCHARSVSEKSFDITNHF